MILADIPNRPGIYRFRNEAGELLYVGKAVRLRARIRQYRLAKACKKSQRKMRKIIKQAASLSWEVCPSELEASLREIRIIQTERPRLNVAGKFSFLYPFIGMKPEKGEIVFCFTTTPKAFSDFQLFGAFRSREVTAEAFFSWMKLLKFLGHRSPRRRTDDTDYSYLFRFRRLPATFFLTWDGFLRGTNSTVLEDLVLQLLLRPGARHQKEQVQECIECLHRFWKEEILPLRRAIDKVDYPHYPVPQNERDPLKIDAFLSEKA